MKTKPVIALAALAVLSSAAYAETFTDRARVVSSHAVQERIPVSREECWNDRVRSYEERRVTRTDTGAPIGAGTILGAVVGGAIGRQFGDSNRGRNQGTAAGAVLGGIIGHQVERDQSGRPATETVEVERVPVTRDVERCRIVEEVREATLGYDVRYEYRGRQFETRMPYDPGRTLEVRVDLQPIEPAPQPLRRTPPPPRYR